MPNDRDRLLGRLIQAIADETKTLESNVSEVERTIRRVHGRGAAALVSMCVATELAHQNVHMLLEWHNAPPQVTALICRCLRENEHGVRNLAIKFMIPDKEGDELVVIQKFINDGVMRVMRMMDRVADQFKESEE